jgi:single-stranded-DNA-specific exonuclease
MDQARAGVLFQQFLAALPRGTASRIHILTDSDADGLPAAAVLVRGLRHAGFTAVTAEPRRKFENAWMPHVRERLAACCPDALMIVDLGTRPEIPLSGVPTLLIDHHAPHGTIEGVRLISSYGEEPTATAGLLAYWCAVTLAPALEEELLWLAAISLLSDLGETAPFAELARARTLFGVTALRELTSLLNAPRRTASADASPALQLLLSGTSPKEILKINAPELAQLRLAKEEVGAAMNAARKARPHFAKGRPEELGADLVAVRMDTPCQVHPLVAQLWRSRFPKSVILGVNTGFRPGFVHFSGRAPRGVPLLHFLRAHTPPGADGSFGGGHDQASGGALPIETWNQFAAELGFGPELQVEAENQ